MEVDIDNNLKDSIGFENDTVIDFLTTVIEIEEEPVLANQNQKTARQQKIKDLLDDLEQKGRI